MKTLILLVFVLSNAVAQIVGATPTNFAIGLSPLYGTQQSEQIERNIKKFVLEAPMGSRILVSDAQSLRSIVNFSVPIVRFDSPANRARTLTPQFGALIQWFKEARLTAQTVALTNGVSLRVPEYLDSLASEGHQPRSVLLLGSLFMEYPTEPSFSMTAAGDGPRVPSDGHLLAPLVTTPYGCAERKGRLAGSHIAWCYGNENVFSNGLHKALVSRFWTLFAKQQGAIVSALTPDLSSAFAAFRNPGSFPTANFEINSDTKIEMVVARPRQIPTWLPQDNTNSPSGSISPGDSVLESNGSSGGVVSPQAQRHPAGVSDILSVPLSSPVDIGIMWESHLADLDLDLYVRSRPGAEELWYRKVRTPYGVYVHDFREPNSRADFEWVKLNPGTRLGEVEAWVNLFNGRGPISGRVAIHFENRTFVGTFHISATFGNGGQGAETRQNDDHWTRLNLQEIILQSQ